MCIYTVHIYIYRVCIVFRSSYMVCMHIYIYVYMCIPLVLYLGSIVILVFMLGPRSFGAHATCRLVPYPLLEHPICSSGSCKRKVGYGRSLQVSSRCSCFQKPHRYPHISLQGKVTQRKSIVQLHGQILLSHVQRANERVDRHSTQAPFCYSPRQRDYDPFSATQ